MNDRTTELKKRLGQLFIKSLHISHTLYQLQIIREKLEVRKMQSFDRAAILEELGHLQSILGKVNSEMLRIHDLLKQP